MCPIKYLMFISMFIFLIFKIPYKNLCKKKVISNLLLQP